MSLFTYQINCSLSTYWYLLNLLASCRYFCAMYDGPFSISFISYKSLLMVFPDFQPGLSSVQKDLILRCEQQPKTLLENSTCLELTVQPF